MQHFKFVNWWIGEFVVSFFDVTNRLIVPISQVFLTLLTLHDGIQQSTKMCSTLVVRVTKFKYCISSINSWSFVRCQIMVSKSMSKSSSKNLGRSLMVATPFRNTSTLLSVFPLPSWRTLYKWGGLYGPCKWTSWGFYATWEITAPPAEEDES
jgi:hypothetical protein